VKLVYDGPHDAVEVPAAGVVAERGKAVEVADDVAADLLEQDTWKKAGAKKDGD
jgi:hypothetical protein